MKKIKLCLCGYPLKKSLSPKVFKIISEITKIKIEFDLIEKKDIDAKKVLSSNYDGFFITLPYKKTFYHYTQPDPLAKRLGIINCIKRYKNKLYSTNTDYKALKTLLQKFDLKNRIATILGNGATAYISAYLLIKKEVKKIKISARNHIKSLEIINLLKKKNIQYELLKFPKLNNSDIVINATPLGMYFEKNIDFKKPPKLVVDFAYSEGQTNLIRKCIKNNIQHINGIEILVMQAIHGFKFITSIDLRRYYKKIVEEFL